MKLLSIDVGIKNLAYCVLDVTPGAYKIVAWDVINLCGIPHVCNQQTKKGACTRLAKYQKGQVKSCKSCAKKTKYIIDSPEDNFITKIYPMPSEDLKLPYKPAEQTIKQHIKYHKDLKKKYKSLDKKRKTKKTKNIYKSPQRLDEKIGTLLE